MTGNQSQYAAHRGVSKVAVHKAIKAGRIRVVDGVIDFEQADQDWVRSTTPKLSPESPRPVRRAPAARPVAEEKPAAAKHPRVNPIADENTFLAARTRREQATAQLEEIKLAKARGEVVDVQEARKAFGGIGKIIAAAREGFPAQVAPMLAGKTDLDEIERIIRAELQRRDERAANEIESRHADLLGNGSSE